MTTVGPLEQEPAILDDSVCLPFRSQTGFAEVRGILKGNGEALILDFELKVLDLVRLNSNVVRIPLADLAAVELKKHWYGLRLIITVNRLEALRQVPGAEGGEVRLNIARRHRAVAEELAARAQMALTASGLKKMLNHRR